MITNKTQLENDLAHKDACILRAASATNHLASVLHEENEKFWSLPTERLLAVLNADVKASLDMFEANTRLGLAINASLDSLNLPEFTKRAPVEPGRSDIVYDAKAGVFVHVEPEAVIPESDGSGESDEADGSPAPGN